jgi:hypothetical protein
VKVTWRWWWIFEVAQPRFSTATAQPSRLGSSEAQFSPNNQGCASSLFNSTQLVQFCTFPCQAAKPKVTLMSGLCVRVTGWALIWLKQPRLTCVASSTPRAPDAMTEDIATLYIEVVSITFTLDGDDPDGPHLKWISEIVSSTGSLVFRKCATQNLTGEYDFRNNLISLTSSRHAEAERPWGTKKLASSSRPTTFVICAFRRSVAIYTSTPYCQIMRQLSGCDDKIGSVMTYGLTLCGRARFDDLMIVSWSWRPWQGRVHRRYRKQ